MALDVVAAEINADFEKFVATWKNKPGFATEKKKGYRKVFADDDVLFYVNGGTKPHRIEPKNARVLVFQGGYTAKTSPGTISSRGGGASGPLVFAKGVNHPGTDARNIDETIRADVQKNVKGIIEVQIVKGAK